MNSSETNKKKSASPPPHQSSAAADSPLFTNEGLPIDHTRFGAALTTASVAEGPTRRVSVVGDGGDHVSSSLYAPSSSSSSSKKKKHNFAALAADVSVEDDDDAALLLAPPQLSPKIIPGRRRQNKRNHPMRSSLVEDEEEFDMLASSSEIMNATTTQHRPMWSSLLHDVSVLPILPSVNHPLEKSSLPVTGVPASLIATRIQRALQRRSIAASYPSPHMVQCVSSAHVEFFIFLYRQGNSSEQQDGGIIVEVQRRDGFDVSYMADVFAILDAASGKADDKEHLHLEEDSSWPMYFEENNSDDDNGERGDQVLLPSILLQTFKKEKKEPTVEEVFLCLSSLASLTNEDKVGPTAKNVSRQFLVSDECKELRSKVLSLIITESSSSSNNNDSSSIIMSRPTLQSLEILANICSCTRDGSSSELLEPIFSANEYALPRHLVSHVENAPINPIAATYACIIFRRFLAEEHCLTNIISSSRLTAALFNAVSLGGEIHAGLERQAGGCLSVMST